MGIEECGIKEWISDRERNTHKGYLEAESNMSFEDRGENTEMGRDLIVISRLCDLRHNFS